MMATLLYMAISRLLNILSTIANDLHGVEKDISICGPNLQTCVHQKGANLRG